MLTKFSNINFDNIHFSTPSKCSKKYVSELSYNSETPGPLILQTPKFSASLTSGNSLRINDEDISSFISSLENLIKSTCHEQSLLWFNGKSFSFDFIQQAFKSLILNDSPVLPLHPDLTVYNHLKEKITLPDSLDSYQLTALFHIDSVWISHSHIGYCLSITQLKLSKPPVDFSSYIIESDDDSLPSDIESEINVDETEHAFFDDLLE
jgi:hypothetical protein